MHRKREEWMKRTNNGSLKRTWERFAPCFVKPGLGIFYRKCHDYFRGEVDPRIHYPERRHILSSPSLMGLVTVFRVLRRLVRNPQPLRKPCWASSKKMLHVEMPCDGVANGSLKHLGGDWGETYGQQLQTFSNNNNSNNCLFSIINAGTIGQKI